MKLDDYQNQDPLSEQSLADFIPGNGSASETINPNESFRSFEACDQVHEVLGVDPIMIDTW